MSESDTPSRSIVATLALLLVFLIGAVLLIVSFNVIEPWKTSLNVIGGFLAISVAVSFIYHATLRRHDDAARRAELRKLLDEKIDQSIAGCYMYGLSGFYREMNFNELFDSLNTGDELWWLDTYAPDHLRFIGHLRNALRRGAKIYMLVLNPESQNAEHRAEEIGDLFKPPSFKEDLRRFWNDASSCKENAEAGGGLELRWYSDLPCMPIYVVRKGQRAEFGFTSFFLNHPTGYEFPHLKWGQGDMLNHFLLYIQNKWEKNKGNIKLPDKQGAG